MSIKTKLFGAVAALVMVTAVIAGPAHAANTETNNDDGTGFTVTGGSGPRFDTDVPSGTFPIINDFHDVALNGTPQLTSAEIPPFTIIDDSGTGDGWHVTFKLPNFDGSGGSPPVLDASGASMNAPVLRPGTADTAMGGVYPTENVNFTGAGKTIVTADPGNWAANPAPGADTVNHGNGFAPLGIDGATHVAGMGTYLVSPQIVKLVVPNTTIADTYTTTANFTIASGP